MQRRIPLSPELHSPKPSAQIANHIPRMQHGIFGRANQDAKVLLKRHLLVGGSISLCLPPYTIINLSILFYSLPHASPRPTRALRPLILLLFFFRFSIKFRVNVPLGLPVLQPSSSTLFQPQVIISSFYTSILFYQGKALLFTGAIAFQLLCRLPFFYFEI